MDSLVRNPATGRSPAEAGFGRNLRDWIPQLDAAGVDGDEEIKDHDLVYKHKVKIHYDATHSTK